ncbi:MAG: bifunctional [glutamine synthetase] adenylyltransferase/[glutamine synthetase]-adenylyl-L-tyrosine phosphorylase [Nostocoides sp.]
MSDRSGSTTGLLARLGFDEPRRAEGLLSERSLAPLMAGGDDAVTDLLEALGAVPDPDLALLSMVRLLEAAAGMSGDAAGHALADLVEVLGHEGAARGRLLAVLGGSTALGDHLVAHPDHWPEVADAQPVQVADRVAAILDAVRSPGELTSDDALRVAYRRQLLGIAALDLTSPDPTATLPDTAAALADLAQAALEGALAIAVAEQPEDAATCRLAVIAMGKTGGRELNYVSDVDVIYVGEPVGDVDEPEAMQAGARLASRMTRACGANTAHGTLWPLDAALRPEGKAGALVRTVEGHRSYYQRWAKTWEFQALLKARAVAGDAQLGAAYLEAVQPMVWEAASRPDFVEDVQAMRRRVEEHVPAAETARQLKLGPGGLRDVEFSVQLLQLVHGRSDDTLRSGTTLDALAALSAGGYVGRDDRAGLDAAYRLLRTLEHRIQLYRLRRNHLMPTAPADLRRLGRALGHRSNPAQAVTAQWQSTQREVRRIHERLFYRPLLSAVAKLSSDEVSLSPEAAQERLAALGFRDPQGALRNLQALTAGLSRRAAIQRTLLPVMLGWFADEANPDAGLLAFRKVSDSLGSSHWYLKMLRDEGTSAQLLAHILGRSGYAGELLVGAPEAVQLIGDPQGLAPRSRADLTRRMTGAGSRRELPADKVAAMRAVRRSELFRIATADLDDRLDLAGVGVALTDITAALLESALQVAIDQVSAEREDALSTRLLIVGMGRLGGGELGYGSDADVMFVHAPLPGADEKEAQEQATEVVQALRKHLSGHTAEPPVGLDADLRPEGKSGPIVRSLTSYRAYYERWSLVWEAQALLRATPMAGEPGLAEAFTALIDPLRWPAHGLTAEQVRDIRRLKARMEGERLPRGVDRKRHLKLGPGGLSDIEWAVQLLQLQHAHDVPGLRTTGTLSAMDAAVAAGILPEATAEVLRQAWELASELRNAATLWRGKSTDTLPTDTVDANGVARVLGMPPGSGQELGETYLRQARHARTAIMSVFYGE